MSTSYTRSAGSPDGGAVVVSSLTGLDPFVGALVVAVPVGG
jgi:hypothetical protein